MKPSLSSLHDSSTAAAATKHPMSRPVRHPAIPRFPPPMNPYSRESSCWSARTYPTPDTAGHADDPPGARRATSSKMPGWRCRSDGPARSLGLRPARTHAAWLAATGNLVRVAVPRAPPPTTRGDVRAGEERVRTPHHLVSDLIRLPGGEEEAWRAQVPARAGASWGGSNSNG